VLFLQGCNFSCPGCHNPHTMNLCNDCGDCVDACPLDALSLVAGKIAFEAALCDQCDACLEACPIQANPMVQPYSVEDVLNLIRKNKLFLNGITVSGGEATTQLKFVVALFKAVKQDPGLNDLTCFIDSNGHLGEEGWNRLLPYTDGVMLDIKAFNPGTHLTLTGNTNERSMLSAEIVSGAGKLHELRFLVVPGFTDSESELDQLRAFVLSLGKDITVKLNAFQHHGVKGGALTWPKAGRETIEIVASGLRSAGVSQVVTPEVYV
jgi:pyruvate formate lyase activating enzyme